uniref:Uncharacterized protein n=1 Tax=Plectus sambesii TaxID=2011161 RepID=A0A914UU74_9BILA
MSKFDYLEGNLMQETDNDSDLFLAMKTLQKYLRKLNVSVDELRQKFGNETAIFYSLIVREYGINPEVYSMYRPIEIGRTTFIGRKQICYEILFDLTPLHSYNQIAIFFSEQSLPNPIELGSKRNWAILDLLGRAHVDTELIGMVDMIYPAVFGDSTELEIEAAVQYQVLSKAKDALKCSTYETVDQCQAICRAKAIQVISKRELGRHDDLQQKQGMDVG